MSVFIYNMFIFQPPPLSGKREVTNQMTFGHTDSGNKKEGSSLWLTPKVLSIFLSQEGSLPTSQEVLCSLRLAFNISASCCSFLTFCRAVWSFSYGEESPESSCQISKYQHRGSMEKILGQCPKRLEFTESVRTAITNHDLEENLTW